MLTSLSGFSPSDWNPLGTAQQAEGKVAAQKSQFVGAWPVLGKGSGGQDGIRKLHSAQKDEKLPVSLVTFKEYLTRAMLSENLLRRVGIWNE